MTLTRITPAGAVTGSRPSLVNAAAEILDAWSLQVREPARLEELVAAVFAGYDRVEVRPAA
jgi:hypothetical protein